MKIHQNNASREDSKNTFRLPYKIKPVSENNFRVTSTKTLDPYVGTPVHQDNVLNIDCVTPRKEQSSPIEKTTSQSYYNLLDVPFRLKTASDDEQQPRKQKHSTVHTFKVYSLPTAEFQVFRKDIGCCANFKKVQYQAHETNHSWCSSYFSR